MAQSNNFMGLMVQSRVLVSISGACFSVPWTRLHIPRSIGYQSNLWQEMVPALVDAIKELGLVLVADVSHDKTGSNSGSMGGWSPMPEGVNGVMKANGILRFHDTIDM